MKIDDTQNSKPKSFGYPVLISDTRVVFWDGSIKGAPYIRICTIKDGELIETSHFSITIKGEASKFFAAKDPNTNSFICYVTQNVTTHQNASGCGQKYDYHQRSQYLIYAIDIENRKINLLKESRVQIYYDEVEWSDKDDKSVKLIGLPNGNVIGFHEAESKLRPFNYIDHYWISYWNIHSLKMEWSFGETSNYDLYLLKQNSINKDKYTNYNLSSTYRKFETSLASKKLAWVNTHKTSSTHYGVQIWNLGNRKFEKTLLVDNIDRISNLLGLSADKLAVCTSDDFRCTVIEIWDVEQNKCIKKLDFGTDCKIEQLKSINDNYFLTISRRGYSSMQREYATWDVNTFECLQTIEITNDFYFHDIFPDGRFLGVMKGSTMIYGNSHLKPIMNSTLTTNQTPIQSQNTLQIASTALWKKEFDEAKINYAKGKGAFYTKDFSNAITFFQLAKEGYKNALLDTNIDNSSRQQAQSRIAKIKEPGRYAISKCHI